MKLPTALTVTCVLGLATAVGAVFAQGRGGQAGPGRGGPGPQQDRQIVAQFDTDGNGRLDADERRTAREWLATQPAMGRGGRGGPGGRGGGATGSPGEGLTPAQVKTYGGEPLYDPATLRTLFFQFENDDWEAELQAFANTDVEVPATLTVDGKVLRDVGVHFRGASSLFTVPMGLKRSLAVSLDWAHGKQDLGGYNTLNLLNSHVDPTLLRTVLYLQAARNYVPAPKANYVRVVINGESWGIYINAQQFNKDMAREWFPSDEGSRWKVPGSPNGRGGLEYLGDDPEAYKRLYEIKSKDNPKAWTDLVALTRTLDTTPADQLERALAPIFDIDGALKFLALELTLVNGDGYWTRASDYYIYQDTKGVFHVVPHDANETFGPGGGRGMGGRGGPMLGPPPGGGLPPMPPPGRGPRMGGPGGSGPELDPLIGLNDASKPLRSKLLAVPALRERYLTYVREIAAKWLDWRTLEPLVRQYHGLIGADVRKDTRKLDTNEAFEAGVATLKTFVERRRAYLLSYKPQ